jgi:hypothetical protein
VVAPRAAENPNSPPPEIKAHGVTAASMIAHFWPARHAPEFLK